MKLTNKYLGVVYQTDSTLADFFIKNHLSPNMKEAVNAMRQVAEFKQSMGEKVYYDKSITDWWQTRVDSANPLAKAAKSVYLITNPVLRLIDKSVKMDKIELKWFNQLPSLDAMYITGKDEFYRFMKIGNRINVLFYFKTETEYRYECYSIVLNDGVLATTPEINRERAERFCKLLLFMELGEVTIKEVKPSEKYKYGTGGDDKFKNEAGINVIVVTTEWNQITVRQGDFPVEGHIRIQPVGKGRSEYRMVWVSEYVKHGYTKRSLKK